MNGSEYVTVADAVSRLASYPRVRAVTPGAVRRAIASGRIAGRKIGGDPAAGGVWLVDFESALEWARTRRRGRPAKDDRADKWMHLEDDDIIIIRR